mmetsp:Transcript_37418/g.88533  ORF Transcript_37418/g.88533 Transcript_37418/m.88533 type:complete len:228 (+) Transcript_37418:484-1167(+)
MPCTETRTETWPPRSSGRSMEHVRACSTSANEKDALPASRTSCPACFSQNDRCTVALLSLRSKWNISSIGTSSYVAARGCSIRVCFSKSPPPALISMLTYASTRPKTWGFWRRWLTMLLDSPSTLTSVDAFSSPLPSCSCARRWCTRASARRVVTPGHLRISGSRALTGILINSAGVAQTTVIWWRAPRSSDTSPTQSLAESSVPTSFRAPSPASLRCTLSCPWDST